MKCIQALFLILVMIITSGCNANYGIKGRVVDSTTGQPLEDALVLVQWTKTVYKSIEGLSDEVILNTETLTDKKGAFAIKSIPSSIFANKPHMIIIKEGYIPWRNDMIFPEYHMKEDLKWLNNETYKLDVFSSKYSYVQLSSFLHILHGGNDVPMFDALKDRISAVQRQRANTLVPFNFTGKIVDAETNEPIEGAIIIASDRDKKSSHGISDIYGNIIISGDYPMLENPPVMVVYKKGYNVKSSWDRGVLLQEQFKWRSGHVFRLQKCSIQSSWNSLDWHIGQLDEKSRKLLRKLITREQNEM